MPTSILSFWFDEIDPKLWFTLDKDFDALLETRFLSVLQQAAAGECHSWRETAEGRLAEIILLDQFSRNIYRHTPQAFAQDAMALVLSQEAVAAGALEKLDEIQRGFLLMPYMHSESKMIHQEAAKLFKKFATQENYDYEIKHKVIIDRFGRYPHRNQILGRQSTAEEQAFLKEPNSSF